MKVYISYLTYYALLKSKNKLNDHHPIIAKLIYLKSLIEKSKQIDENVMPELVSLFNEEEEEEEEVDEIVDDSEDESCETNEKIIKENETKFLLTDYSRTEVSTSVVNIIQSYIPYIKNKIWYTR